MGTKKINSAIIRIVGLIGDQPVKAGQSIEEKLQSTGYIIDKGPDEKLRKLLKDIFYPDFRNIMFLRHELTGNKRLFRNLNDQKVLVSNKPDGPVIELIANKAEAYLFPGHLGLFSIQFSIPADRLTESYISDACSMIRNFDTHTDTEDQLHAWISKNILSGIVLRGDGIKADEYSGSKFKLYIIIDCDLDGIEREHFLYDMATVSPIGTASGSNHYSPAQKYYDQIMAGRISVFNNWDAICLFDTFTVVGSKVADPKWVDTNFRIYLFRLFFKYNLYRYNTYLHDSPVALRKQFEEFLNVYNLSHISFNFLPNELFSRIGEALELEKELSAFSTRIERLSTTIQEEKQSRTNNLLQAVTILGSISSIEPVINMINMAESYMKWSHMQFYSLLAVILAGLALLILYYLMPEKLKKVWISIRSGFLKK
jgi:hypothetical protein